MSTQKDKRPSIKKLVREMERTKIKLAYYRDRLRDIQEEAEAMIEPTDRGIESLQSAIDDLSEQY